MIIDIIRRTATIEVRVGPRGPSGVIPGGTTGQVLAKASNADGDVEWVTLTGGGPGGGVTDHGLLTGLADDDHPQYHNNTRGDARYSQLGHTHTISNVTGLQAALDGKATSSHTHAIANVTGLQTALDGKEAAQTAASQAEAEAGTQTAIRSFSPLRIKQAILALSPGGPPGADGVDGASAYEIAVANGFVGDEATWLASLVGPAGADGTDGAEGPQGIQGPPGNDGGPGSVGADGLSAYEIAVANGFVGTQSEWLASLQGDTGPTGATGADGASAYEIAVANGFVGDEATWLASLVGPAGADGTDGAEGAPGSDATVNATNVASTIHAAAAKTTPIDADTLPLIDSAASNVLKKLSWANIKATLKSYFDTLYAPIGGGGGGGSGSIVWTDSVTKLDTQALGVESWTPITGLSMTRTLAASGNKVTVEAVINGSSSASNLIAIRLTRNGTPIGVSNAGTSPQLNASTATIVSASNAMATLVAKFTDTPGAGTHTYAVEFRMATGAGGAAYINRPFDIPAQDYTVFGTSNLELKEIAA
jgi:hypothetical protein